MRKKRPIYPRKPDIDIVLRALRSLVPMDTPLEMSWRNSHAGNPNLRVKSLTKNIEWVVDVYPRNYFYVCVDRHFTQACHSIPSLVGYICRMLGVVPNHQR
jgi:hypothetical protein